MKIDIVRATPTPPPIDHVVITLSAREFETLRSAVLRNTRNGLVSDDSYPVRDLTQEEWNAFRQKLAETL